MSFSRQLIAALCILFSTFTVGMEVKLQSNSRDGTLPVAVMKLLLDRAGLNYSFPYENEEMISDARIRADLSSGDIDVIWAMTSKDLEEQYQAIYFPVFRGLLGLRVAIVKQSEQNQFSSVRSLNDLKRFSAGQGKTWSDTFILESNGLKVEKTLKYENLFPMLEGDRFDYFPRGIHEPWREIERFSDLNLVVDKHVLIRYVAPLYFFVNKNNQELAKVLSEQFENVINDGSFEKLFFNDSDVNNALSRANPENRVIIELDNPLLTPQTPVQRKKLWFDPLTESF